MSHTTCNVVNSLCLDLPDNPDGEYSDKHMSKKVCVIGATGVAGSAFIDYCLGIESSTEPANQSGCESTSKSTSRSDALNVSCNNNHADALLDDADQWLIYGVSRQAKAPPRYAVAANRYTHISADLLGDFSALGRLRDVTHIVFAGFVPADGFENQVEPNRRLLENCLQALADCPLEQVVLLQGMKYYGSHLGKFKTPAREHDPRHDGANYYYAQQDLLQASGLGWTCLRPHVICGTSSFGTTQNILAVLAVYATMVKASNEKLDWPGSEASFNSLNQATDASLLARAIAWSLHSSKTSNQAFNITNGDFFRWQHLWPRVAEVFDVQPGTVKSQKLSEVMPHKEALWQQLARQYQLQSSSMQSLADWNFADYILNTSWDVMANTSKAREYGFPLFTDTEQMYVDLLQVMRRQNIVP